MMNKKHIRKVVFFLFAIIGMSSMASTLASSTSDRALTPEKIIAIESFWQLVTQDKFVTTDNITISYAVNLKSDNRPYIVIVPGRSESYVKYKELAYDFDKQGYGSVIIDHRGQGLSQRLLANRFKGYVASFDDYAQDLNQLLQQVLPNLYPNQQHTPYMLAHSMGGAIALRYLQNHKNNIQALALSSPMIAISSGNIPHWLAKSMVKFGTKLNHWLSNNPWYFLGQDDAIATSFADNQLMHSKARFQRFIALYQEYPEIKLGGVTFNWLDQALKANENIFSDIAKINLPILMMQASKELIVDNMAQTEFCKQLQLANKQTCVSGKPKVIDGAYHELFFEIDEYRDLALNSTLDWFEKQH